MDVILGQSFEDAQYDWLIQKTPGGDDVIARVAEAGAIEGAAGTSQQVFAVCMISCCCIRMRTTSNGVTAKDVTSEPRHAEIIFCMVEISPTRGKGFFGWLK